MKNFGLKLTTDLKYKETSLAVYIDFKKGRVFLCFCVQSHCRHMKDLVTKVTPRHRST